MIELFENDVKLFDRHSSKGNQLKWEKDGIWYKADYTGYEGLAEYVTPSFFFCSPEFASMPSIVDFPVELRPLRTVRYFPKSNV